MLNKNLLFSANRMVYEVSGKSPAQAEAVKTNEVVEVEKSDAETTEGRQKIFKKVEDVIKDLQARGKKEQADSLQTDLSLAKASETSASNPETNKQQSAEQLYEKLLENVRSKIIDNIKRNQSSYIETLENILSSGTNADMQKLINETLTKLRDALPDDDVLQTIKADQLMRTSRSLDSIMMEFGEKNPEANKLTDKEVAELEPLINYYKEQYEAESDWVKQNLGSNDPMVKARAYVYSNMLDNSGLPLPMSLAGPQMNDRRNISQPKIASWTVQLQELQNTRTDGALPDNDLRVAYNTFSGGKPYPSAVPGETDTAVATNAPDVPPPAVTQKTPTATASQTPPTTVGLGGAPQTEGPRVTDVDSNAESTSDKPKFQEVTEAERDTVVNYLNGESGLGIYQDTPPGAPRKITINNQEYFVTFSGAVGSQRAITKIEKPNK